MKQVIPKEDNKAEFPERSAQIDKEIADWRTRLTEHQAELASIESEQKDLRSEMDKFLLGAARGNVDAERKLAALEGDDAVSEAHRKRIGATVSKIEAEISRLEPERQEMLRQEAGWRIENRMGEVKRLTESVWRSYQVTDGAIAELWGITRLDQIDGATLGLSNIGTSHTVLHARHLLEFLNRLKSHADNNREVGGEQLKEDSPTTLATSQAALQRDIDIALGRESKTIKAA